MAAFDTLAYAKKLKAAGVPELQAEIHAETFAEFIEDKLATRQDIMRMENEIKHDMQLMENTLKQDMQHMENELKQDMLRLENEFKLEIHEINKEIKALDCRTDVKLAELKTDLIKWVVGISAAQAALIISVIRLLSH